jgi:hypothetical protein
MTWSIIFHLRASFSRVSSGIDFEKERRPLFPGGEAGHPMFYSWKYSKETKYFFHLPPSCF